MEQELTFEPLLQTALELDEEGLDRKDEAIIGDQNIRFLLRENRIALQKGRTIAYPCLGEEDRGTTYYVVPLICVVHSHPECRFEWSRLTVDLSPARGARIRDMVPLEIREKPVEIKTSVGLGLKFETTRHLLGGAEVKAEYQHSRTCYYPDIVSCGIGFDVGYWDFLALTSDYLHSNRELYLLVQSPSEQRPLARFNLTAKVKLAGVLRSVPLLARKGAIDEVYKLD